MTVRPLYVVPIPPEGARRQPGHSTQAVTELQEGKGERSL